MTYFDPSDEEDLSLLHPASVREHEELASVAAAAERDVMGKADYREDEDAEVTVALRLTIAEVTAHRLQHYDTDDTITSEKRGGRSVQRAASQLDADWPERWDWRLRRLSTSTYAA